MTLRQCSLEDRIFVLPRSTPLFLKFMTTKNQRTANLTACWVSLQNMIGSGMSGRRSIKTFGALFGGFSPGTCILEKSEKSKDIQWQESPRQASCS